MFEVYRPDGALQFSALGQVYALKSKDTVTASGSGASFPDHRELYVAAINLVAPIMVWGLPSFGLLIAPERVYQTGPTSWSWTALTNAASGVQLPYYIFDVATNMGEQPPYGLELRNDAGGLIYHSSFKVIREVVAGVSYPGRALGFAQTHSRFQRTLIEQGYGDVGESEDAYYNVMESSLNGAMLGTEEGDPINAINATAVAAQATEYDFNDYPAYTEISPPAPQLIPVDLTNY